MSKNLRTKTIVTVAILLACLYGIFGLPTSGEQLRKNLAENIRLGLDLKGGSQLVLQVQMQDAFRAEGLAAAERLKQELNKAGITYTSIDVTDPPSFEEAEKVYVTVKGIPSNRLADFRNIVNDRFSETWNLASTGSDYRLEVKPTAALDLRRRTFARTRDTIERRIDSLGLAESAVQERGRADAEGEILVQLPGVDDPGRIKALIQTAAVLEIAEVKGGPFASREEALQQNGGVLPLNTKLGQESKTNQWYLLSRYPVVGGMDVRSARPGQNPQTGQNETQFNLSQDAARRFETFTAANIGKPLAIVLDNKIQTVATIRNKISDTGVIEGQASPQESTDLATVLNAGALPAGLSYLEERTVGPSLGADSIRQGLIAGTVGLIAVVAVMLIYYKKAGINATLALILNALILIAALAYFGAALTLPGIAGIILTIGIAVDSNVLIFERIREELKAGKSVASAIDAGFSKAFATIIDTHITTVVSCAFLFIFGTGPVKGFAVTLVIGLIANVFTAVFVSKLLFEYTLSGKRRVESLSI